MVSSSSFPIGSSNISSCLLDGSSSSHPPKKREGCLFDGVGVFGKKIPELSLLLRGMKEICFFSFRVFFKTTCRMERK